MTFRCSDAARERGDHLAGTASTVRRFLLVEHPGPWGVTALRDAPMPDDVRRHLAVPGTRTLLMRKHRRRDRQGVQVLAADIRERQLRGVVLDDLAQLTDLDLASAEWGTAYDLPFLGVCTHGRHDACCAERGRPVAAALDAADSDLTWEVSHIGGDRFAANVLALPAGVYFGRVEPEHASALAAATRDGRILIELARGRSDLPMAGQFAELHLRRDLGLDRIDDVELVGRQGAAWVFHASGEMHSVEVSLVETEPHRLTCRAARSSPGQLFHARSVPTEDVDGP